MRWGAAVLLSVACSSSASRDVFLVQADGSSAVPESASRYDSEPPAQDGAPDTGTQHDAGLDVQGNDAREATAEHDAGVADVQTQPSVPDSATVETGPQCNSSEKMCAGDCVSKYEPYFGCAGTCTTCPAGPTSPVYTVTICTSSGACGFRCPTSHYIIKDGACGYNVCPGHYAACKAEPDGGGYVCRQCGDPYCQQLCCTESGECGCWDGLQCNL